MPDTYIPPEPDDYDEFAGAPVELPPLDPVTEPPAPPPEGIVPLGHDRGVFFYLSQGTRQVFALQAGQHNRNTLMAMASGAHYWERSRFTGERGVLWDQAIDWLMGECRAIGIFDPTRLRGRGAWIDDGRSVLHLGDRLIVDGTPMPLILHGSRYVYEAARPLGTQTAPPLTARQAHALVGICARLRWERGISGTLLAGYIATAPICGGLAWRASIWLTGGSGSGKTYVAENIVQPALAGIAIQVQSKTTEAGIRQLLGSDALPVLFDEAEREDAHSAHRMQGVLDLIRQASSETGGAIAKGTQNQSGARVYRIRSAFFLQSINAGIEHQADESRISVLALRSPSKTPNSADVAAFEALHRDVVATITPEFAAGLVARSVRLLPTIRANAETFARAVALHLGSRRMGDQIGTLLAGAYSLHSDRLITPEQAEAYVQRQEWRQVADDAQTERDELRLLAHLTQHRVRVAPGNAAQIETTIGRLIATAWGDPDEQRMSRDVAEHELRNIGIIPDTGGIIVSNTHPFLREAMRDTPWSGGWQAALLRLPGAERAANGARSIRFTKLHVAKAVFVPRDTMEGNA